MPSCVVKSCKNHSGYIKKSQGITFHRFPSANDPWKSDWVQIIRESRKEANWNPSKSSVVCSVHFVDNDLYTTKCGRLRVVSYAVPKMFLFDTLSIQEEQHAETNPSIASHGSSIVIEAVASGEPSPEGQQNKLEQYFSENNTTPFQQILSELPIRENQPAEANISSASQVSSSVDEGFSVPGLTLEQSCLLNTNASLPHELSIIVTPTSGVELEQTLSVLYSPRKRRMKKQLFKMHTLMQNKLKIIKVLNQKVRRLQKRNKSLKDIIKTLRRELC